MRLVPPLDVGPRGSRGGFGSWPSARPTSHSLLRSPCRSSGRRFGAAAVFSHVALITGSATVQTGRSCVVVGFLDASVAELGSE